MSEKKVKNCLNCYFSTKIRKAIKITDPSNNFVKIPTPETLYCRSLNKNVRSDHFCELFDFFPDYETNE